MTFHLSFIRLIGIFFLILCIQSANAQIPEVLRKESFFEYEKLKDRDFRGSKEFNPDDIGGRVKEAAQLLEDSSYEEALALFLEAEEIAPGNAIISNYLAITYLSLGRLDLALDKANEAIKLDVTMLQSNLVRMDVHLRKAIFEKAEKEMESLEPHFGDEVVYFDVLARIRLANHDYKEAESLVKKGLKAHPESRPLTYLACQLDVINADTSAALERINLLISKEPESGIHYYYKSKIMLAMNKREEAYVLSKKAYDLHFREFENLWLLGYVSLKEKNLLDGLTYLKAAFDTERGRNLVQEQPYYIGEIENIVADLYEMKDDLSEEDREYYVRILGVISFGLRSRFVDYRRKVEGHLNSEVDYRLYLYYAYFMETITYDNKNLDSLLNHSANPRNYWILKILLYHKVEKYEEGLAEADLFLEKYPEINYINELKINYMRYLDLDYQDIMNFIESCLERFPENGQFYRFKGLTLLDTFKRHEAIEAFEKSRWYNPWSRDAYYYLAQSKAMVHDYQGATDVLNEYLFWNPNDLTMFLLAADTYSRTGKYKEALDLLDDLIKDKKYSVEARIKRVELKIENQDCKNNKEDLTILFYFDGLKFWNFYQKSLCFYYDGDMDEAMRYATKSENNKANYPPNLLHKARLYFDQGNYTHSYQYARRCLDADKFNVDAAYHLALSALALKEKDEAMELYEQALGLNKKLEIPISERALHDLEEHRKKLSKDAVQEVLALLNGN